MKPIKYYDWYVEWRSGCMLILNGHHDIINTHWRNFLIESVIFFHVFNASKISLFEYLKPFYTDILVTTLWLH